MDPAVAGRTARSLETLHALCYFAPEVDAEVAALGVRPGRTTYFASRSAAMGRVGPGTVTATFLVFNPTLVAKLLPPAWEATSPAQVAAARLRGVDAAYRRLLGDDVAVLRRRRGGRAAPGPPWPPATPAAARCTPLTPTWTWPVEPHLALWFGFTLLREFRGDGHIAATLSAGLTGLEALVTHTATGTGFTEPAAKATRGWSEDQWGAAVAGLAARGLMTADGGLTEQGTALRAAIESATDERAAAPWDALGEVGASRLAEIGRPLARQAVTNGAFPDGVFAPRR